MKNPKVLIPVLLLIVGGVYKFMLAPKTPAPKPKIAGSVYVMPKDFLINLAGGKFAKLNAALVLKEGYLEEAIKAAGGGEATTPPDGYGTLPQEAAVRAIITDSLTGINANRLIKEKSRLRLQASVLKRIKKETDVEAEDIMFTDLAVQ
ncbi:MAG TPA: flagellar basal body-associated FliL family protein [Baekduia sp.]|uniref:flagellar basal body-associated FliL family protein n=1 Tax=Baekduia sp. TaxID=2600305 RepID=UPI002D790C87|nr:flagellar basal body-associated FliL family protein [Baekduia sp.]HET6508880.1 flagellar basal body-associated FliL family protein [Baekduia sp.]